MKLILVRHTSVDCKSNICYGQTDVDVAQTFDKEAETISLQLRGGVYDAVFSSPLQRCTKLASHCGFCQPKLDNRLMELNFGDWEGMPWDEISDPNLENWYADWINVPTTNGESFAEQVERVKSFLDELKSRDYDEVLVFAHAGVIRAVAILLGVIDIQKAFSAYSVDYGEIKLFEID